MKPILVTCLIAALLCVGCAADRRARSTAAELSGAVKGYQSEVDAKVAAEKKFYHDQLATLRRALGANDAVTQLQETAATKPELPRSLPYMRVITSANRDARLASDAVVASKDAPMTAMIEYLEKGVSQEGAEYLSYLERQRLLMSTLGEKLEPIGQQKAKADEFGKAVDELAKSPSTLQQAKDFAKFAKEIYDQSKPKKP